MRAGVARALVAAGLVPALGIGHQGESNPFNLADDVLEPFRPFVDLMAWKMGANEKDGNLSIEDRRAMAGALLVDARSGEDSVTLLVAAETAAQSLVRAFEERESRATPPAAACTPAPELEPVA
jgi:CRISP-associated protein Cas1